MTPYEVAAAVVDPEIRVITIADLGVLRDVDVDGGRVTVTITPTYSGCPAMDVIRTDIRGALSRAGYADVEVRTVLRPAWTTDWITREGRRKLAAAGIAPPAPADGGPVALRLSTTRPGHRAEPRGPGGSISCPRCGSPDTSELSHFGSTACKSLWRCRSCAEPFDHVKAL